MIDINDSIRKFKGTVYQNIQRENIKIIQTPQAFKYKKILSAHLKSQNKIYRRFYNFI